MEKTGKRTLLEKELEDFIERIKRDYAPLKIIVFGSMALGTFGEGSDVDIIIIKETREDFWDRLKEVSRYCSKKVGMDILVYTPEEFEKLCQSRLFFKQEILKKGKVLYERR